MSRKNKEDTSLSLVPILDKLSSRTARLKRLSSRKDKSSLARRKLTSTAATETCVLRKTRKTGRIVRKTKKEQPTTPNIHNTTDSHSNASTVSLDTIVDDDPQTETNDDDNIIMCAKTRQEKEKQQLARQRQLDNMKAREAAEAREERLLKRSGLWTAPAKKQIDKKISWNKDIVTSIFNYQQVV